MNNKRAARLLPWWQLLFLLVSTTWLLAPVLNNYLSSRTALISQYEVSSQAYAWLFRSGDFIGGTLLLFMGLSFRRIANIKTTAMLLCVIGLGMLLDPLFTTSCHLQAGVCVEQTSLSFYIHAGETVITAVSIFILSMYDIWKRRRLVSITFASLQISYFILFLTQYATKAHFNTLSQYLYQLLVVIWLAWFCRDYLDIKSAGHKNTLVKYGFATWAFLNGLLAIVLSLTHISLLADLRGLYFADDTAWLAQHGIAAGVVMLYLSRHLARGERRARHIFLVILLIETIKFSVIAPNLILVLLYFVTFCLLYITGDVFDRGVIPITWRVRRRDLAVMISGLAASAVTTLIILDRDNTASRIARHTFNNFSRYWWSSPVHPHNHLQSVLFAHTISAFILIGVAAVLWILFRPGRVPTEAAPNYDEVKAALAKYSNSTEDYFKLWPHDKHYFSSNGGFIAYKASGPVIFALADPIVDKAQRAAAVKEFVSWARAARQRVCFMPIYPDSLKLYEPSGLNTFKIGSSAMIDINQFVNKTSKDKWWRWQNNRGAKKGFVYEVSEPPHSRELMQELANVSNAWLARDGRKERAFALGYFDTDYLQNCRVHLLKDNAGHVVAFTNQLPTFGKSTTATVDLLRHLPDIDNAMPFLLMNTVIGLAGSYEKFDLGFVPFAAVDNLGLQIAKTLSAGRFSSKGLEQFKSKFDPVWVPNYLAYDGDLADLALVALNIESVMDVEDAT